MVAEACFSVDPPDFLIINIECLYQWRRNSWMKSESYFVYLGWGGMLSLLCSPGSPGTHSVGQAVLLPSLPSKCWGWRYVPPYPVWSCSQTLRWLLPKERPESALTGSPVSREISGNLWLLHDGAGVSMQSLHAQTEHWTELHRYIASFKQWKVLSIIKLSFSLRGKPIPQATERHHLGGLDINPSINSLVWNESPPGSDI